MKNVILNSVMETRIDKPITLYSFYRHLIQMRNDSLKKVLHLLKTKYPPFIQRLKPNYKECYYLSIIF